MGQPDAETRAKRKTFISKALKNASPSKLLSPETFLRDTSNPTHQAWNNIQVHMARGGATVVKRWADPVLGYERFVADMGTRPEDHGLSRPELSRPWGPDNAHWVLKPTWTNVAPGLAMEPEREARRLVLAERYGLNPKDLRRSQGNPLILIWRQMVSRCNDTANLKYAIYGGRGIQVHDLWDDSCSCGFEEFSAWVLSNLGQRPSKRYTLDRVDSNGDYKPGNIRWATPKEQANNKRTKGDPEEEAKTVEVLRKRKLDYLRELGLDP